MTSVTLDPELFTAEGTENAEEKFIPPCKGG